MPSTINSTEELVAGLDAFWRGAATDSPDHEDFLRLLKRGKNFVCSADRIRMAPSRFVGYSGNTLRNHAKIEGRDGGVTDTAIVRLLGQKRRDQTAETEYTRLCESFGITPYEIDRRYWVLSKTQGLASAVDSSKQFPGETTIAQRLGLPRAYEGRMQAIVATTSAVIREQRPEWYRARLDGTSHLRIFCGRLIVATLAENYVWLAVDENLLARSCSRLSSWSWDDPQTRPKNAKGQSYPRYKRPPSRNGYYDPKKDPEGLEWGIIEAAHGYYLHQAARYGRAPDHRTTNDPGVLEEIATWKQLHSSDMAFDLAVRAARFEPDARRARLAQASRIPEVRAGLVVTFRRNPDVVAEILSRANGMCEACKQLAPFMRASDGTPYLEVHHKVRLADGGEDTVENTVALCPNCHREKHFG